MEEFVTITSNGITMVIPAKEVSLYTRAGYKVVKSAPVEKGEEVDPPAPPVDPPVEKPVRTPRPKN